MFSNQVKVNFTNIPEQKFPDGARPQEITKYNMDYSFALESMFHKMGSANGKIISHTLFESLTLSLRYTYKQESFPDHNFSHKFCSCDLLCMILWPPRELEFYTRFIPVIMLF